MPPTRDLLLKIARLAGDERGDPATRAVAMAKLEEIHATYPELFVLEKARPTAPAFEDEGDIFRAPPPSGNPERDAFLDPRFWRQSAKGNTWRKYRGVTITIFIDARRGGFKWCVSDSDPLYSHRRFAAEDEAMLACWVDHVAPRFGLAP
jgi:hypothetical protein